jgi:hypothetical protein
MNCRDSVAEHGKSLSACFECREIPVECDHAPGCSFEQARGVSSAPEGRIDV